MQFSQRFPYCCLFLQFLFFYFICLLLPSCSCCLLPLFWLMLWLFLMLLVPFVYGTVLCFFCGHQRRRRLLLASTLSSGQQRTQTFPNCPDPHPPHPSRRLTRHLRPSECHYLCLVVLVWLRENFNIFDKTRANDVRSQMFRFLNITIHISYE